MPTVYYEYRFIDTIKIQISQNITAIIYNYTQNKFYKAFRSIVSSLQRSILLIKPKLIARATRVAESRDCVVLRLGIGSCRN